MDTDNHWIFFIYYLKRFKVIYYLYAKKIYPRVEEGFNRIVNGH